MPEEDITKQIEERIAQLPQDVRDAIAASDLDDKIRSIGTTHNLHIDQTEALDAEVYLVMLGINSPEDFISGLVEEVRVSKEEAEKIAADVNAQILAPIRESLKRAYTALGEAPAQQTPPAASQKSVVMPSSLAAKPPAAQTMPTPSAPAPAPSAPPMPPKPAAAMPTPPVPPAPPSPLTSAMPKPPIKAPDLHPAEVMLKEKTLQMPATPPPMPPAPGAAAAPKPEAPKPQPYAADPYREPIE